MTGNFTTKAIAAAIFSLASLPAISQSSTLSIQKFSNGIPDPDSITVMTQVDDHFVLNNVTIPEDGFIFLAMKADTTEAVIDAYYTLYSKAAPIVYGNPNPLTISGSDKPIKVAAGTYDISFYNRDESQSSYHQMIITPAGDPGPFYPSRLYLMSSTGTPVEIDGSDGIFHYEGDIPSGQFQIAYEPIARQPLYVYGPESAEDTDMQEDVSYPIAYGTGTKAYFSFDNARREGSSYMMQISLPDNYVKIINTAITGIGNIDAATGTSEVKYYNLQGRLLPSAPGHGFYITVSGGKAHKMIR